MCSKVALIVPTFNGEEDLRSLAESVDRQTFTFSKKLVIDSSSKDCTVKVAQKYGFNTLVIPGKDFHHGRTRQYCVELLDDMDVLVFMTQDAHLSSTKSIENMLEALNPSDISAVYGRQRPRPNAGYIEAHARLFNYPDHSRDQTLEDIPSLGLKAAFFSDSFSAYKREKLLEVGGFPGDVVFGEDTIVAARMILRGWKIRYSTDAEVFHSHHYSLSEEFKRCFQVGVLHSRESWLMEKFGRAEGEGFRFVQSEISYLMKKNPFLLPEAFLRTFLKLCGYQLGIREKILFPQLKKLCGVSE
jgi:rhamnosyltransferase